MLEFWKAMPQIILHEPESGEDYEINVPEHDYHKIVVDDGCRIRQRVVLAIMLHLAFQNAFSTRVVLNVAIVEMVQPEAQRNHSEQACPEFETVQAEREDGKFDWPQSVKTQILYAFFVGYCFTCLPGGWLADKFGGRYTLGGAILLSSVITLSFPYVTEKGGYIAAVVLRGILGIVQGPVIPSISSFVSTWIPPTERNVLGGICYGGSNLGTILGSILTGYIIDYFNQWHAAFYFWAAFAFVYVLLHALYVFSYPSTHPFIDEDEVNYIAKSSVQKRHHRTPWKAILLNVPFWANVSGQFGHNYIFFILVTWLPTYMNEILRYDIAQNGLLSSMPFIALWVSSLILSFTGNYVIHTLDCMSTLTFSKAFGAFSNIVSSALVLAAVYAGCNRTLCIIFYIVGMIIKAFYYSTLPVNINELSKNYGGVLFGICISISSISGLLGSLIVGTITKNHKLSEWKLAFWITFIIEVISSLIYIVWASSDRQAFDYEGEDEIPE